MILIAVLYAVFAGMTFINSKLMLTNPFPFFAGMLRSIGSSVLLFGYAWFVHKKLLKSFFLPIRGIRDILIFGALVHGFAMCGFSYSVQYITPVKLCFIVALSPFITALIQYFTGEEKLSRRKIIGLAIGFIGLIPILLTSEEGGDYSNISATFGAIGTIVCVISVISFAYGWISMKRFLRDFSDYPIEFANSIAMLTGGCISFVLFVLFDHLKMARMEFSPDFPLLMLAFILSSLATYSLYAYLLRKFSTTFIAFAGFLEPVFGMLLGVAYLGHKITFVSIGALLVLSVGLYIFYKEELIEKDLIIDHESQ